LISADDGHQPAAEVRDLARVGAVEPQPGLLHRVVRLAHRAKHPIGHRTQPGSVLLELLRQKLALIHRCHIPWSRRVIAVDPRNPSDVTSEKENTMRVFVAGASGAIGTRLVPPLVDRGHQVIGTSRSADKADQIRALGADPVALDLLDARAVRKAVLEAAPDAIVHQATALAELNFSRNFDRTFADTNRLRTGGTDALLAAAREAGVDRFVAQSYASSRTAREGGPVKAEDDPLDPAPPAKAQQSFAAMAHLERVVTEFGGIVLRYGVFYGAANDGLIEPVRKRQYPIIGDGAGIASWIHLDDAAAATVLALENDGPGIYNIVDDDPAPVREWLPVLAEALGAGPPRRFPRWLARLVAGDVAVVMGTESRGASNAKAKGALGWQLRYPSWREGFVAVYASGVSAERDGSDSAARARRSPSRLST
jgi:nucleoside-diphosphate-sugar epimerase